jgi:hypothetical protein
MCAYVHWLTCSSARFFSKDSGSSIPVNFSVSSCLLSFHSVLASTAHGIYASSTCTGSPTMDDAGHSRTISSKFEAFECIMHFAVEVQLCVDISSNMFISSFRLLP